MLLPTYPIWSTTVTSSFSEKKNHRFRKHFFSFYLRCFKKENLWCFSPYSVTTTIIWPTTDRIPRSLIFKRMQIKRIADNIRASFFYWQIGTKNPKKRKFIVEPSFFHKLDNNKWKCTRAHVQENKSIYLSIYLSIWKPFWKRVYIYIEDITLWREYMNFIFEWQNERSEWVKNFFFCHEKIKFIF